MDVDVLDLGAVIVPQTMIPDGFLEVLPQVACLLLHSLSPEVVGERQPVCVANRAHVTGVAPNARASSLEETCCCVGRKPLITGLHSIDAPSNLLIHI